MQLELTDADFKQADETIEFIRDFLGNKAELSDYEHNLLLAVQQSSLDGRLVGITASAIPFYLRETGKMEEQKKALTLPPSTHMGTVGERIDFFATLVNIFPHESDFGVSYITKLVTDSGQVLTWFASNDLEAGDVWTDEQVAEQGLLRKGLRSKITGKVKGHGEYKGVAQTTVTRCTVWTTEGIKQAEEKAARKLAREQKKAAKQAAI